MKQLVIKSYINPHNCKFQFMLKMNMFENIKYFKPVILGVT